MNVNVIVTPLEGPWEEPPAVQLTSPWGPEAEACAEVIGGATYSLLVSGRVGNTREHVVRIPEGSLEHREEITIGAPRITGSLRVSVLDPDGVSIKVGSVAFVSEPSGHYLDTLADRQPDEEGRITELPVGRYKARVYLDHGQSFERGLFLPRADLPIEVSAGEESTLVARALRGARITLLLEPDGWPADVPDPPDPSHEGYPAYLRAYGLEPVFVSDEPDDFSVSPPRLGSRPLARNPDAPGIRGLVAQWIPGEVGRHWRVVVPGTYHLRVRGPGWQDAETELELAPGEDAFVRLVVTAKR